jgi:hypothetical protein
MTMIGLEAGKPVALRLSDSTLPDTGEVAVVIVQLVSRVLSDGIGREFRKSTAVAQVALASRYD